MPNNRRRKKGILLITTLLIIGFLTAMTVGFISINRDNLFFAQQTNGGQLALEAAYAGLNYAMMRFEQDANFGIDPQAASRPNADNNPFVGQYDAFPDGRPGGTGGNYWTPGGGMAIPYQKNYLTVYETGQTVVGVLSGGTSHFQIHFAHYPGTNCPTSTALATTYSSNGFNDNSIQGQPFASWNHMQIPPNEHSLNNLNNGSSVKDPAGKTIPGYTAHIIAIGYANGVTRVAEALVKEVFYSNSTISSAHDISMHILSLPTAGNGNLYLGSLAPFLNNIQAGIQYNSVTKTFQVSGGNLNFYSDTNGSFPSANMKFSVNGTTGFQGAGYALMPPGTSVTDLSQPGLVQLINNVQYPTSNGQTSVSVGGTPPSGVLYAKASQNQPLPTKDLKASDLFSTMNVSTGTDAHSLIVPVSGGGKAVFYIPAGTWAFRDQGTTPNTADVYNSNGAVIATFNGTVVVNGTAAFTIKNYKLMIPPGVHLVVDSNATAVSQSGNAQGNLMLTLSPKDFNSGNLGMPPSNTDSLGNSALPNLALGYVNAAGLGSAPSTLTLGGNLYAQGPVSGQGNIVAQSYTTSSGNWAPSGGDWTGNPWGSWVITNGSQSVPAAGDVGDVYFQGNSKLSKTPNASVGVYGEGNVTLNPVIAASGGRGSSSGNSLDAAAMQTAMNNFAGGAGSGGYWDTSVLPSPVSNTLNNWITWSGNSSDSTAVLRCALCANSSLEYADTGKTAVNVFGSTSTDTNVINYLANNIAGSGCQSGASSCSISGGALNLYQYKVLSNYQSTKDTEWLAYTAAPGNGSLDAVEASIVSGINGYAQQAYGQNQFFGAYLSSSDPSSYQNQDIAFQGVIYAKGGSGFGANSSNYRFSAQGVLISTKGAVEIDNAGQINFLFDPAQLSSFYQLVNGGNKVAIQWVTIW